MNIHDKDQFAKDFEALDAPEQIRNQIDEEDRQEFLKKQEALAKEHKQIMQSKSGKRYSIESGEIKPVEVE